MTGKVPATVVVGIVIALSVPMATRAALKAAPAGKPTIHGTIEASRSVVKMQNAFALDLYRQIGGDGASGNLFCSPYSVYVALAMTAEGARGETAEQMGRLLHLPASLRRQGQDALPRPWVFDRVDAGLGALAGTIARHDASQYELRVANALWGDVSHPFDPRYVRTIATHHGADGLRSVDFRGDPEAARQRINAWVSGQTAERIRDILPNGSVDERTRLVLANAIYFKGQWAKVFEEGKTKEQPFRLADGATATVPLMQEDLDGARYGAFGGDGRWFETPSERAPDTRDDAGNPKLYPGRGGFQVAELPYKGGDMSMVVLLPEAPAGLAALEQTLTADRLTAWIHQLQSRRVDVQLPRFRLEQGRPLSEPLQAMGMTRAFVDPATGHGAQFEGMTASTSPDDALFIKAVFHKAFVEVNEKGAEAAAATAVGMGAAIAVPRAQPFVPTFRADRPFLFLIRDVHSGSILFLGRFARPE